MIKALYYPHTNVTNPLILKNALLLWDSLETIVPRLNWSPKRVANDRWINEAIDLVVKPRVPNQLERRQAHMELEGLSHAGFLAALVAQSGPDWSRQRYLVYPDKFLDKTWHMLEHGGMAH